MPQDAWGNTISVTDSVPGGWNYRFVGALGVRWDPTTNLYYMRERWYDSSLGRFISRDLLGGTNRYTYGDNNPTTLVDPVGLAPSKFKSPWTNADAWSNADQISIQLAIGVITRFDPTVGRALHQMFMKNEIRPLTPAEAYWTGGLTLGPHDIGIKRVYGNCIDNTWKLAILVELLYHEYQHTQQNIPLIWTGIKAHWFGNKAAFIALETGPATRTAAFLREVWRNSPEGRFKLGLAAAIANQEEYARKGYLPDPKRLNQ